MTIAVRALTLFKPDALQEALCVTLFGPYNDLGYEAGIFIISILQMR